MRVVTVVAMKTLEQQFNSRVRVFLGRTGLRPTDRVLAFVADYDLHSGGPRTPPRGHRRPEAFVTGEENEEEQSDE